MNALSETAAQNLENLRSNPYPGRAIIIGTDEKGNGVQIYWIMGRSESSRNRFFAVDEETITVEAIDRAKVKDPELTLYTAMMQVNEYFVVSNGSQTAPLMHALRTGMGHLLENFADGLKGFEFEPDIPNFTPRISGLYIPSSDPSVVLSILRKSEDGNGCERALYPAPGVPAGFGLCITTYSGDGKPLPSFRGEPFFVPLQGDIDAIANLYWNTLNEDNKVSLAVKIIPGHFGQTLTKVINKYKTSLD